MAQTSFPWPGDSGAGGTGDCGPYTANIWSDWYEALFTSNSVDESVIPNVLNELAVSGSATPLSVASGWALVNGKWYKNTAATTLAIATPVASTRIDRVILRVDYATQTVRLVLLAGAEGGAAPTLTQTDGTTWEVSLAQASITTGGVVTITDERVFLHHNTDVETAMIEADAVTPAKIPNRTRKCVVPAGLCYNTTDSLPVNMGGVNQGAVFPDAKTVGGYGCFMLPMDYVSGLTIAVLLDAQFSGNIYGKHTNSHGAAGEAFSTHDNSIAASAVALSALQTNEVYSLTPTNVAAGDYFFMYFERQGAHANDTIGGQVNFFGWIVSYTADS